MSVVEPIIDHQVSAQGDYTRNTSICTNGAIPPVESYYVIRFPMRSVSIGFYTVGTLRCDSCPEKLG
jgi:hypothetical protein